MRPWSIGSQKSTICFDYDPDTENIYRDDITESYTTYPIKYLVNTG
jgi:hypothetical protein